MEVISKELLKVLRRVKYGIWIAIFNNRGVILRMQRDQRV